MLKLCFPLIRNKVLLHCQHSTFVQMLCPNPSGSKLAKCRWPSLAYARVGLQWFFTAPLCVAALLCFQPLWHKTMKQLLVQAIHANYYSDHRPLRYETRILRLAIKRLVFLFIQLAGNVAFSFPISQQRHPHHRPPAHLSVPWRQSLPWQHSFFNLFPLILR